MNKITRPGQYPIRNSTHDEGTGRPTTKLSCIECGNDAHPKGGVCPARGNEIDESDVR